ncbi:MAG: alpha/beta hydrolase [Bacteroidetes bacterium]|nr:MAG: alpha/beta hydrolase [Bacteroidota bacterium]
MTLKSKLTPVFIVIILFFSGCKFPVSTFNGKVNILKTKNMQDVASQVKALNDKTSNLKPDNEARIIWANPKAPEKTEYVLVYIHGFSASCKEGYPTNYNFAKRYGINMYCARLADHGVSDEKPMINLTAERYLESAKQALQIGSQLGEKVILMSTSTGGTLSLKLAADNPWIYALIMYSPNVDVVDKKAHWLTNKFGYGLAKMVKGDMIVYDDDPPEVQKYWQSQYHINGVRAMTQLLEKTMTPETFARVKQPVFVGYYYKNEEEKDPTVSIDAMMKMYDELGTPANLKQKVAFPNAGCHPIPSGIHNKHYKDVEVKTYEFAEKVLGMKPVNK